MAEGNEGFGVRWSRRKSEARGGEVVAEEHRSDDDEAALAALTPAAEAGGEVVVDADALSADPAIDPPDPADFDLPPIESLTVESDYSPFMRDGIPSALQRLALRRLWKLMPIVPDGLDDYDEDYSMIGMVAEKISTLFKPGEGMRDPEPEPNDPPPDEPGHRDVSAKEGDEAEEKVASGEETPSDGTEDGTMEDGGAELAGAEAGEAGGDDGDKYGDVESDEV